MSEEQKNETAVMNNYDTVERVRIMNWLIVLMFLGYGIPTTLAFLAGWRIWGFDLDPWVLGATIVSMTSTVTYMMRNVMTVIFPTN